MGNESLIYKHNSAQVWMVFSQGVINWLWKCIVNLCVPEKFHEYITTLNVLEKLPPQKKTKQKKNGI